MTDIKSGAQALDLIDEALAELKQDMAQLEKMHERWSSTDLTLLADRMATRARISGVGDDVIAEYTEGIRSWLAAFRGDLGLIRDNLLNARTVLGSLSHCITALAHKAKQAASR